MTVVEHVNVVGAGELVELGGPASFRLDFIRFVFALHVGRNVFILRLIVY